MILLLFLHCDETSAYCTSNGNAQEKSLLEWLQTIWKLWKLPTLHALKWKPELSAYKVWIVGFCSSFVVFKLPVKLKNGFFTSLDLFELAWSVSWELFYKASNSSLWFVNTWLPKGWEEHFWEVIKASISFFTLVYTLVRDDRL